MQGLGQSAPLASVGCLLFQVTPCPAVLLHLFLHCPPPCFFQPASLSYIPAGYFCPLFWFQGIHSRGVNSLQGLVDIHHLSSHLAGIIPVTINDCFFDIGLSNNSCFLWDGGVSPMPTPPLLPRLGTGWIYPGRVLNCQNTITCFARLRKI